MHFFAKIHHSYPRSLLRSTAHKSPSIHSGAPGGTGHMPKCEDLWGVKHTQVKFGLVRWPRRSGVNDTLCMYQHTDPYLWFIQCILYRVHFVEVKNVYPDIFLTDYIFHIDRVILSKITGQFYCINWLEVYFLKDFFKSHMIR